MSKKKTPQAGKVVKKAAKAPARARRQSEGAKGGPKQKASAGPDVEAFMRELDHPLKKEIELVRGIILGTSPEIQEGIKWKAPSFRTNDDFATINLRSTDQLQVIFHTGARVKSYATTGIDIDDAAGLLDWLAKDRAMMTLADAKAIRSKKAAIVKLVRDWIQLV